MSRMPKPCLATLLALFPLAAPGAQFCVATPAELQAAFDAAAANAQSDTVRIVGGTLRGGSLFSSNEAHDIHVSGGYAPGCVVAGALSTTLDGETDATPMTISTLGGVEVLNLTFINGLTTTNSGGLSVFGISGDVRIEGNRFVSNRADDVAGAFSAVTISGSLLVRNNLVFANASGSGAAIVLHQATGVASVTSNTIYGNTSSVAAVVGGLWLQGEATFVLANNILWGNEGGGGVDLYASASSAHARIANDIGSVRNDGPPALLIESEQDAAPGFAPCAFPCLRFELARSSPLVDAGVGNPVGGLAASDLAGKPRVIGPRVDIGAWENDVLLDTGFE